MAKRQCIWLAAVLVLAAGCTPPPYPQDIARQQQEARDRVVMAPYIGRSFWTVGNGNYFVCPSKAMMLGPEGCFTGRGQFTFDSFEGLDLMSYTGDVFVHITFADGRSGFTHINPNDLKLDLVDHDPMKEPGTYPSFLFGPKAGKAFIARRNLQGAVLHMTEAQVLAGAWGKPERIADHDSAKYGVIERWFYPEGNELVFQNGRLAEIRVPRG